MKRSYESFKIYINSSLKSRACVVEVLPEPEGAGVQLGPQEVGGLEAGTGAELLPFLSIKHFLVSKQYNLV